MSAHFATSFGDRFSSNSSFINAHGNASLAARGECKAGLNVFCFQRREIIEHGLNRHATAEIVKHIGYRDSRSAYAWLATANAGVNRNMVTKIHDVELTRRNARCQMAVRLNAFRLKAQFQELTPPMDRVQLLGGRQSPQRLRAGSAGFVDERDFILIAPNARFAWLAMSSGMPLQERFLLLRARQRGREGSPCSRR